MLTVRVPRFSEQDQEFIVMIMHQGETHVHTVTLPTPRTPEGGIDHRRVDEMQWAEYLSVMEQLDTIWPNRTPDPLERPIAETVIATPLAPSAFNEQEVDRPPDPGTAAPLDFEGSGFEVRD